MLQFDKCWTTKSETIWFCISNIGWFRDDIFFHVTHYDSLDSPLIFWHFRSVILGLMDFPWKNEGCFVETALKKQGIGMCSPFFWAGSFKRHLFQRFKIVAIHLVFVCLRGWNEFFWTQAMSFLLTTEKGKRSNLLWKEFEFFREVLGGKLVVKTHGNVWLEHGWKIHLLQDSKMSWFQLELFSRSY